jgi:hypothetical protein
MYFVSPFTVSFSLTHTHTLSLPLSGSLAAVLCAAAAAEGRARERESVCVCLACLQPGGQKQFRAWTPLGRPAVPCVSPLGGGREGLRSRPWPQSGHTREGKENLLSPGGERDSSSSSQLCVGSWPLALGARGAGKGSGCWGRTIAKGRSLPSVPVATTHTPTPTRSLSTLGPAR